MKNCFIFIKISSDVSFAMFRYAQIRIVLTQLKKPQKLLNDGVLEHELTCMAKDKARPASEELSGFKENTIRNPVAPITIMVMQSKNTASQRLAP